MSQDPYKIGYCPQCGTQVMVRDVGNRWSSYKPKWRQVDMIFDDGHKCRTVICSDCLKNPDFKKLMEAILHDESQACSEKVKKNLKARGVPVKIEMWGLNGK